MPPPHGGYMAYAYGGPMGGCEAYFLYDLILFTSC